MWKPSAWIQVFPGGIVARVEAGPNGQLDVFRWTVERGWRSWGGAEPTRELAEEKALEKAISVRDGKEEGAKW